MYSENINLAFKIMLNQAWLHCPVMEVRGGFGWFCFMGGTIDLNKFLSLNLEKRSVMKLRFTEYNNLLVLCIDFGLFTIQLQSLQFKVLAQGR